MNVQLAVVTTFVLSGVVGVFLTWVVSLIRRAELRPGSLVRAFFVAAILGVVVASIVFLKLVQDAINANYSIRP